MQFGLRTYLKFAARQGLEPQYPGPKPGVLPLDDRAMCAIVLCFYQDQNLVSYYQASEQNAQETSWAFSSERR